jgi:hypothetical protein
MRLPGRVVNAFLLWGIKRSAYFKDAERNQQDWDRRFESAVTHAESLYDEPGPR